MLCADLKKSLKQHSTKQQVYGYLPLSHKPSKQDKQDKPSTAGEVRTSSQGMLSHGLLHMDTPVLAK